MNAKTISTVEYKGILMGAVAFQVSERQGYFCSLLMTAADASAEEAGTVILGNSRSETGLFSNGIDAIAAAIAGGKEIIDGEERALADQEEGRYSLM